MTRGSDSSNGSPPVRWERRGPVAVITLSRPDKLNALSNPLNLALCATLEEIEADRSISAAVLTGEGRAFSAGGDLADVAERITDGEAWSRLEYLRSQQLVVAALRESRLPIVAAAHGSVYGAAWSLCLCCDLVVAARETKFCQIFVKRGLTPDLGSAWLLPKAVGMLKAKELMLLADEIDAEQASELGLVNRLADSPEEAVEIAVGLGERLAEVVPATMAMTKSLINGSEHVSLEDSLRLEEHAQSLTLGTPETLGALRAFLERRAAKEDESSQTK